MHGLEPRLRVLETRVLPLHYTVVGWLGRARTYDIGINSAAQLPTVLLANKPFWYSRQDSNLHQPIICRYEV